MLQGFGERFRMRAVGELPVAVYLDGAVLPVGPAARLDFVDAAKDAAARGASGADQQNFRHPVQIDFVGHVRVRQQGFDLRGEQKLSTGHGIKQRLDADPVAGQEQPLGFLLQHGKGENAVEFLGAVAAPLGVGVQHHLGVAMGGKDMSGCPERPAERIGIVQLAVIDDGVMDSVVVQLHGLLAALRIDDGQPGMQQSGASELRDAALIRSPPAHGVQHGLQQFKMIPGRTQNTSNCTHSYHNPFPDTVIYAVRAAGVQA